MTIKLAVKNEKQDAGSAAKILTFSDMLITVGSLNTATVRLDDPQVAPEQAVIINENGEPLFINQNKGTVLNGKEIEQGLQHKLQNGDEIKIGVYSITVELENQIASNDFTEAPTRMLSDSIATDFRLGSTPELKQQTSEPVQEKEENKLDARNFRDILKNLRKEEDQFYFQITDADGAKRRIVMNADEVVLGWNSEQNLFTGNQGLAVDQPQAIARKDWGGVTIYPSGEEAVLLNDALLEASAQLRNGDKIVFTRRLKGASVQTAALIFCEPAALVELNQILPQQLLTDALEVKQTVEVKTESQPQSQAAEPNTAAGNNDSKSAAGKRKSRVSLYFNQTEALFMMFGTVLVGVLTFLLLLFLI